LQRQIRWRFGNRYNRIAHCRPDARHSSGRGQNALHGPAIIARPPGAADPR
jgi:hypothetical protein